MNNLARTLSLLAASFLTLFAQSQNRRSPELWAVIGVAEPLVFEGLPSNRKSTQTFVTHEVLALCCGPAIAAARCMNAWSEIRVNGRVAPFLWVPAHSSLNSLRGDERK